MSQMDFSVSHWTVGTFVGIVDANRYHGVSVDELAGIQKTAVQQGLGAYRALPNDVLEKPVARNSDQQVGALSVILTNRTALGRTLTFLSTYLRFPEFLA